MDSNFEVDGANLATAMKNTSISDTGSPLNGQAAGKPGTRRVVLRRSQLPPPSSSPSTSTAGPGKKVVRRVVPKASNSAQPSSVPEPTSQSATPPLPPPHQPVRKVVRKVHRPAQAKPPGPIGGTKVQQPGTPVTPAPGATIDPTPGSSVTAAPGTAVSPFSGTPVTLTPVTTFSHFPGTPVTPSQGNIISPFPGSPVTPLPGTISPFPGTPIAQFNSASAAPTTETPTPDTSQSSLPSSPGPKKRFFTRRNSGTPGTPNKLSARLHLNRKSSDQEKSQQDEPQVTTSAGQSTNLQGAHVQTDSTQASYGQITSSPTQQDYHTQTQGQAQAEIQLQQTHAQDTAAVYSQPQQQYITINGQQYMIQYEAQAQVNPQDVTPQSQPQAEHVQIDQQVQAHLQQSQPTINHLVVDPTTGQHIYVASQIDQEVHVEQPSQEVEHQYLTVCNDGSFVNSQEKVSTQVSAPQEVSEPKAVPDIMVSQGEEQLAISNNMVVNAFTGEAAPHPVEAQEYSPVSELKQPTITQSVVDPATGQPVHMASQTDQTDHVQQQTQEVEHQNITLSSDGNLTGTDVHETSQETVSQEVPEHDLIADAVEVSQEVPKKRKKPEPIPDVVVTVGDKQFTISNSRAANAFGGEASIRTVEAVDYEAVGALKELANTKVNALPAVRITMLFQGGERLLELKRKINEIHAWRQKARSKVEHLNGANVALAIVSLGASSMARTTFATHYKSIVHKCKVAVIDCVQQVNEVRAKFAPLAKEAGVKWAAVEKLEQIRLSAFIDGVPRSMLKGGL